MNDKTRFTEARSRMLPLGRAEHSYDLLMSHFAGCYLDIQSAGYDNLPELEVLHTWLRELNFVIRPSLIEAWKLMAEHFGFSLGQKVNLEGTLFYPVRVSVYPDEQVATFTGFAALKSGKPGKTSVCVEAGASSVAEVFDQHLAADELQALFFENITRRNPVRSFLDAELAKLS